MRQQKTRGLAPALSLNDLLMKVQPQAHLTPPAGNRPQRRQPSNCASRDLVGKPPFPRACEVTMSVTIERLANPEPGLDVKHTIQSPDTQKTFFDKRTESIDFTPTKVSFGLLRLFPTQFLLLEGDEHVSTFFASDEHR